MSVLVGPLGAALRGAGALGWLLPYGPSFQIDLADRRALLNGAAYYDEAAIKSLFSTFSTPAHIATGSDGKLYPIPANSLDCFYMPAGKCQGQLIEEARTNLCFPSQNFGAAWAKTNVTIAANAGLAPDGTMTATRTIEASGAALIPQLSVGSVVALNSTTYAYGVFAKRDTRTWLTTAAQSTFASNVRAWFNLATGAAGTKAAGVLASGMIALADGWYYCWMIFTSISTAAGARVIYIAHCDADNSISFTGDGVSGIYLWGVQVEVGSSPTSYIPTTAASVTRAAPSIIRTLGSEWNRQGSLAVRFVPIAVMSDAAWGALSDGTVNNRIILSRNGTASQANYQVWTGAAVVGSDNYGVVVENGKNVAAIRAMDNDMRGVLNGTLSAADVAGAMPTVTGLRIGASATGIVGGSTYISRMTLWRSALADAQLQGLAA
jgi:hypothetical protein